MYVYMVLFVYMSLHRERRKRHQEFFYFLVLFFIFSWRKRREVGGLMIPQMDSYKGYERVFFPGRSVILDMED